MRPPVIVKIGDEEFKASPLTLGALRSLTADGHLEALDVMAARGRSGETPTAAESVAFYEAMSAVLSAGLVPLNRECSPEWVADHVTNLEGATAVALILHATGISPCEGEAHPGGSEGPLTDDGWGHLFAHLAISTGWTLRQVEDLTLFDLRDLNGYFEQVPPLHISVATCLGTIKEPKRAPSGEADLR